MEAALLLIGDNPLIVLQGAKFFRLVKQYRAEQQAELDAKRAEAAAELEEARRMKEELERLKAQLQDAVSENQSKTDFPDKSGGEI